MTHAALSTPPYLSHSLLAALPSRSYCLGQDLDLDTSADQSENKRLLTEEEEENLTYTTASASLYTTPNALVIHGEPMQLFSPTTQSTQLSILALFTLPLQ